MTKKTIILERFINGKLHRARLSQSCFLHCEIIEALFNRLIRSNVLVDIDILFNQVVEKY